MKINTEHQLQLLSQLKKQHQEQRSYPKMNKLFLILLLLFIKQKVPNLATELGTNL